MADERFSKGPWRLELGGPPCIVSYDGETVVDLPMWQPEYLTERNANAHLIKSAPALFEALRDLLTASQPQSTLGPRVFIGEAQEAALAALRKAKGEQ